jgi:hypothetical protein
MPAPLEDLSHVIQLSVAPVFLLTAVGTILSVLSTRLGRIVDRVRVLQEKLEDAPVERGHAIRKELASLGVRKKLVDRALTFGTITALLVCVLIVVAFVGYIFHVAIGLIVAVLFILAMFAFIAALVWFLREVLAATASLDTNFR